MRTRNVRMGSFVRQTCAGLGTCGTRAAPAAGAISASATARQSTSTALNPASSAGDLLCVLLLSLPVAGVPHCSRVGVMVLRREATMMRASSSRTHDAVRCFCVCVCVYKSAGVCMHVFQMYA
jgi:hypothetical protein